MSLVGKPIKSDQATTLKDRITYARYMVEVDINGKFPDEIEFVNEMGVLVKQEIQFEWKPIRFSKCNAFGDDVGMCKKQTELVWRPKSISQNTEGQEQDKGVVEGLRNKEDDQIHSSKDPVVAAITFQPPPNPIRRRYVFPRSGKDSYI